MRDPITCLAGVHLLTGTVINHAALAEGAANNSAVLLTSKCGFGADGDMAGDAVGLVTGWSVNGGTFVVDGLQTALERWGAPVMHQHKFRYVSDQKLTTDGDLRAFLLTSERAPTALPASWLRGCHPDKAVNGMCVTACVGVDRMDLSISTVIEVVMVL
jgi:hypothetical protein